MAGADSKRQENMAVTKAELSGLERALPNTLLAGLSAILAFAALVAVSKGQGQWGKVPPLVWLHLLTVVTATVLTPIQLLRAKGTANHRVLGYLWAGSMFLTAAISLTFKSGKPDSLGVFSGDFSVIHILSVIVLIQVPRLVIAARNHDHAAHERGVRGIVIGALLIAGFFTFAFNRMLGDWLLS
jgi:uncharacterized membrane protein